mgnify:CR=1
SIAPAQISFPKGRPFSDSSDLLIILWAPRDLM